MAYAGQRQEPDYGHAGETILMELKDFHPAWSSSRTARKLDAQIAATFAHTRLTPARATSGRHLVELVNSARADVITSIINKFNTVERQEIKNPSRDIFVLVDESHRSNYGLMATRMRVCSPTPATSASPARR